MPALLHAQEEPVSTWNFANNIGWKGIELQFVAAEGSNAFFHSPEELASFTVANQLATLNNHMLFINPRSYRTNFLFAKARTLNIHGIFLPFRASKIKFIRHLEWQTGMEYHLGSPKEYYDFIDKDFKSYPFVVQLYNRNLFFSNKLLGEFKIAKNIKLYLGPQFKFTLVPFERLELARWETKGKSGLIDKYIGIEQLNSTRFAVGYGFNGGMKINLSCRFNFHFEYQYYTLYRIMQVSHLSMGYHGLSMGIRYKFTKPDPIEGDKEYSPFW
ncbi:MAG: hypothetical protein LPK45_05515 [Bacteroidota bacterium]|nr:hypothetical protein [Bacteroidota bacterium]MDX5430525.1 hypothetical protein [Bacteroidota bacterium]MDX5469278.1 hypothetical protein [Bacteroidota bacterium]